MHAAVEAVLLKSERLVCHRANYLLLAAMFAIQQHLSLKAIVLTTATKERVGGSGSRVLWVGTSLLVLEEERHQTRSPIVLMCLGIVYRLFLS